MAIDQQAVVSVPTVDAAWGSLPPAPGIEPSNYVAVWSGLLDVNVTDVYTFRVNSAAVKGDSTLAWMASPLTLPA